MNRVAGAATVNAAATPPLWSADRNRDAALFDVAGHRIAMGNACQVIGSLT